ncbi:MAG: 4-hydroxy-3-methylbut-2-enyl diphosphate reductase [Planctomycetota bacterium]
MRVILAAPRGFCAGVQMAVDVVDRVVQLMDGETVHVYHDIVHNTHVVSRFRDRGVVFVEDVDDVPEGGVVVFSAHGISPAVRARANERGLDSIDATCPLVTKVHAEAIRYRRQGYRIAMIGHRGHQEVIGTTGEAPEVMTVVETPEEARSLDFGDVGEQGEGLAYLTQTTLSTDDAGAIIAALKERFPGIKEPPGSDICYATTNRQHAVRELAPECDVVLVVGSETSSNSKRLTEIAANVGTPGYLMEDVEHLDESWLPRGGDSTVLLTSGASVPEDLVAGVCRGLIERFGGTLEQRELRPEDVEFALPAGLRRKMVDAGVRVPERGIQVGRAVVTEELYGAVPLTVGGGAVAGGRVDGGAVDRGAGGGS